MEDNARIRPRSTRSRRPRRTRARIWLGVTLVVLLGAAAWLLYDSRFDWVPSAERGATSSPAAESNASAGAGADTASSAGRTDDSPLVREIDDFRMLDLDIGWYLYADGVRMVTEDGGVHWREAGPDWTEPQGAGAPEGTARDGSVKKSGDGTAEEGNAGKSGNGVVGDGAANSSGDGTADRSNAEAVEAAYLDFSAAAPVSFNGQTIAVKRAQAVSGKVAWVLAAEGSGLTMPLLVTVDGGSTWRDEVTADVRAAIEEEKAQRERRAEEAKLYASPQEAVQAMKAGSEWALLPDKTYPGDVVLVRRGEPGELQWQGKTYKLQPYKAGYFTYLPIPRTLKPGSYAVGDTQLIVEEKSFKEQHLKVSEQMASMRQNTERIQADQKKIDAARASSELAFLFDSTFLVPLEGRLTTPFGYTRYINGKLSSSHMALDIAAPQGTPIKATNDGVVALADELYLTGNTIYLDHGMYLFSQYAHLSELHVKAGDQVKKGDIIGLVGSTGFSTGPHLHFTFWAHNVQVNPNLFFDSTPFQWLTEP